MAASARVGWGGRPEIVRPAAEAGGGPAPAPVPSTGERKARAVDRELLLLAGELGVGRDAALFRALAFYRKFVRRGRRYGHAPDAFLRELFEAFDNRDIHAELAKLREAVGALATAKKPGAKGEGNGNGVGHGHGHGHDDGAESKPRAPTALEIYRALKLQRLHPCTPPPEGAAPAAAPAAPTAPAVFALERIASPTPAPPEAKSDYADRRARLPKITF